MRTAILLSIVLLCTAGERVSAQQDSSQVATVFKIVLSDGSEIFGTIVSSDSSHIGFLSLSQIRMNIPKAQIKFLERVTRTPVDHAPQDTDPNNSRLFLAPTGRPLPGGHGSLSVSELFFPMLSLGIGDIVTIAGGISVVPGAENQLFYVAPKITPIRLKNIDISAGVVYASGTAANVSSMGILFAVGTYGSDAAALTGGLLWPFASREVTDRPMVLIGIEYGVSRGIKIISEDWIRSEGDFGIYSIGVRFFGQHVVADLGFARPSSFGSEGFPLIPWVGFAYCFGAQ